MAGRSDEAGADERAEAWADRMQAMLKEEVEALVAGLPKTRPGEGADHAALDRHARAVTNIARAVKAVTGLSAPQGRRAADQDDDMNEKDFDDIDPSELARIRGELQSKLDHVAGVMEKKRLAGWAGSGAGALGQCADGAAAGASGPAPG